MCAVVLLHTAAWDIYGLPLTSGSGFLTCLAYDVVVRFCVPVFFMMSGARWLDPKIEITFLSTIF